MTVPPARRMARAQLAAWNAGTVLVAVGVTDGAPWLTDAGVAALLGGLALFAVSLRGLARRSLQRAPWALRWYLASALCLAGGAVLGALLARGTWIAGGSILGAHIALNVGGWFGSAIVGTLHTFYPSLTHTQAPALDALHAPARLALGATAATLAALIAIELRAITRAFRRGPHTRPS